MLVEEREERHMSVQQIPAVWNTSHVLFSITSCHSRQDNECVETDRQLLKGPFLQISLTNQILRVLCLDIMLGRSLPLGSALASALLSGARFPFRVGIPNSIQSSKVRKEEDFENFICWACNSLPGPGTTVICDNVRPHA